MLFAGSTLEQKTFGFFHPWQPAPTCNIGQGVRRTLFKQAVCAACPRYTYSAGGQGATCRPCARVSGIWWCKAPWHMFGIRSTTQVTTVQRRTFSNYRPGSNYAFVEICGSCAAGYGLYGNPLVCTICPKNTYSPGSVQGPCYPCGKAANGDKLITESTGATKKSACIPESELVSREGRACSFSS